MGRARTMVNPRRFAVTVQCNTGLDLILVDASTIAYAREQARAKHGGDVRILAARVYRKGMVEARFDLHGVLARERDAQYERHALPLAERRALDEQLGGRATYRRCRKRPLRSSRIASAQPRRGAAISAAHTIVKRCGMKRPPTPMMTPRSELMHTVKIIEMRQLAGISRLARRRTDAVHQG